MKKNILIVVLVMSTSLLFAQPKSDNGQDLVDTFFNHYKDGGYEPALKYALSTNKWIPAKGSEMDNIIVRLGKDVNGMGQFLGQEEIKSKTVGSRFRIVSYLVYYQRDPVRFTFELYKNDAGWEISNFEYDFKFDKELEESMKLTVENN